MSTMMLDVTDSFLIVTEDTVTIKRVSHANQLSHPTPSFVCTTCHAHTLMT